MHNLKDICHIMDHHPINTKGGDIGKMKYRVNLLIRCACKNTKSHTIF